MPSPTTHTTDSSSSSTQVQHDKGKSTAPNPDPDPHHDTCVICLAPLTNRAIAYPCNHLTFDLHCLTSWLAQRTACPLCNTPVQHVEYDHRAPWDYKTYHVPPAPKAPTTTTTTVSRPPRPYRPRPRFSHPLVPDLALQRRRLVHARQLFSLHRAPARTVPPLTPARFRADPALQRRARLFLRRELRVFSFLSTTGRLEFVLEYVVGMMRRLELKGADGAVEGLLAEVLGRDGARLLVHEMGSWMGSAFERLEDWDRSVQYDDAEIMRYGRETAAGSARLEGAERKESVG